MQEVYQGVPVEGEGKNRTGWREELGWRQSQGRTQLTLNGRAEAGLPFRVGSSSSEEAGLHNHLSLDVDLLGRECELGAR